MPPSLSSKKRSKRKRTAYIYSVGVSSVSHPVWLLGSSLRSPHLGAVSATHHHAQRQDQYLRALHFIQFIWSHAYISCCSVSLCCFADGLGRLLLLHVAALSTAAGAVAAAAVLRRQRRRRQARKQEWPAMLEMPRLQMAEHGGVEHLEKFSHYVGQSPFFSSFRC